ncbi:MAG: hypothetical protein M0011_12315, partial [Elusimicrobia bacterium]|nr:hypothetical protein [Elusimicrobiota bacterium]
EQNKKALEILPGVPQKDKMGEPSLSSSLTMVKEISATLILDKSLPDEDVQLARKLAAGLLGLPADRQDLITIEKMDFRKTRPIKPSDFLSPPNLWSIVWILVVAALVIFTVSAFLSPLSKSAGAFVEAFSAKAAAGESSAAARSERREEAESGESQAKQAETAPQVQAIEGRKPPFWFLSPAHLGSLAFIMKNRPSEDLTILLSYAPEELAVKLSEALYPKSTEALAALPKVALMPESRIRGLESEILSSLDYVVGGEDKTADILSALDESVQEKALAAFTRLDPMVAKKMKAAVVRLSNVADLSPAHAQALARRLPMRVIAAALKGSPFAATFIAKLAGGMQDRLKQELELTRDLPAEAYKADRAKLVDAMRQMSREGLISLKPQGPAPVRPAGAVPPAAAKPGAAPRPAAGISPGPAPAPKPAPAAAAPKAPAPNAPKP